MEFKPASFYPMKGPFVMQIASPFREQRFCLGFL